MIERPREARCTTCARPVVWITATVDAARSSGYLRHAYYPTLGLGVDDDCDLPFHTGPPPA
jgi:hypothetical protein